MEGAFLLIVLAGITLILFIVGLLGLIQLAFFEGVTEHNHSARKSLLSSRSLPGDQG